MNRRAAMWSILLKSAAIVAVYGVLMWLMQPLGTIGFVAALISGTSSGGIIFLTRRQDVIPLARVIVYTLVSVLFGFAILAEMMMPRKAWQGTPELAQLKGMLIGGIAGAFIAILINESYRSRDDSDKEAS